MFEVRFTSEAREVIGRAIANNDGPKVGLMIHRQGLIGEITRSANGLPTWSVEHRYPWAIQIGSNETIPDDDETIVLVDGIRIWLPIIPRQGELGVIVTVRESQLHVEAIID